MSTTILGRLPGGRSHIAALLIVLSFALLAPAATLAADLESDSSAHVANADGDQVNFRDGPGLDAAILNSLSEGTSVHVLDGPIDVGDEWGWYHVAYGDSDGYIAAAFLAEGDGDASAAPDDTAGAPADDGSDASGGDIVSIIYDAAARYGQSGDDMLRVATCESNLNPDEVGAQGEQGIFQFMPSTWTSTPYADQSPFDPWANANAAGWMWSVGRRGEWVCQ